MLINVVSFNIRRGNDELGDYIDVRAPRIRKVLENCHADLMGFQEFEPEWEPVIMEYYGDEYEMFNRNRSEDEHESAPIFWKKNVFKCLDKGYFWLSDTPEVESKGWDEVYDCYRICMWVILEHRVTGKRIWYMNTHFGFGDNGQVKSAQLIRKYQKNISEYPAIITGDFNMTQQTPGYKKMTEYYTDVNMATVRNMKETFHNYYRGKETLIDFCFVGDEIVPVSYEVIDELVDGKYPSDHYGILAKVDVK